MTYLYQVLHSGKIMNSGKTMSSGKTMNSGKSRSVTLFDDKCSYYVPEISTFLYSQQPMEFIVDCLAF